MSGWMQGITSTFNFNVSFALRMRGNVLMAIISGDGITPKYGSNVWRSELSNLTLCCHLSPYQ